MNYQVIGSWIKHPERPARRRKEILTKAQAEKLAEELTLMYGEVCLYAVVPVEE